MAEKNKNDIINLRRAQLIKATYQVVSKKGYYDFTIRDIAQKAELSTGLVHYYFKNKQDLLLNLIKDMNRNLVDFLNRDLEKCGDNPVEMLKVFLTQAFQIVSGNKDYIYIVIDFWTQINRNKRIHEANKRLFKSYRDQCSSILKKGVEKGVFVEMDTEYVTAVIISMIQGMIIQHIIDPEAFDYDDYTNRIIDKMNELVLKQN